MEEVLVLKKKILKLKEKGFCEVFNLGETNILNKVLSTEGVEFAMEYKTSETGGIWCFNHMKQPK